MIDEKTELSTITIDDLLNEKKLVLYNDNHNSFQYVMLTLSSVLNYTLEQSEQNKNCKRKNRFLSLLLREKLQVINHHIIRTYNRGGA